MTPRPDFQNCPACEMPRSCQGVRHCAKRPHPGYRIDPQRQDEYDSGLDAVDTPEDDQC